MPCHIRNQVHREPRDQQVIPEPALVDPETAVGARSASLAVVDFPEGPEDCEVVEGEGTGAAAALYGLLTRAAGRPVAVGLECGWDGSRAGSIYRDGPVIVVADRQALRRVMWAPNRLGLARAWVTGELEVRGELPVALARLADAGLLGAGKTRLGWDIRVRAGLTVARLAGLGRRPRTPGVEVRSGPGRRLAAVVGIVLPSRHSPDSDAAAVRHHYDVGNDFYRLVLGESMVYSCAYWGEGITTLDDAQCAKLELICRKLGLRPGMRLLDVGCGWGGLLLHAARRYGVHGVGITLSAEQADYASAQVAAAGLGHRIQIGVQDYRTVEDDPYDAIASIGMAEHVGRVRLAGYARTLHRLLAPGGRLLHAAVATGPAARGGRDVFIQRYVFPDGELLPVATACAALERAGLEVRDVHALREHYPLTLRAWLTNLERRGPEAVRLSSPERVRTWRLYLAGAEVAFARGELGVHHILAVRLDSAGASGMSLTRPAWTVSHALADYGGYGPDTALIVIDMQNDFADPTGRFAIPDVTEVIPVVNAHVRAAHHAGARVFFTQHWHPPDPALGHGTSMAGPQQHSWGAALHPEVQVLGQVVRTGTPDGYGLGDCAPGSGLRALLGLRELLEPSGVDRVTLVGLAADRCLRQIAIDAAGLGYQVAVRPAATRFSGSPEETLAELRRAGVALVD